MAATYDPLRNRLIVFGGFNGAINLGDVWELSLSGAPTWTQLLPTGTPPTARRDFSLTYDPVRDRVLLFGGYDVSERRDLWDLSLEGTTAWTRLFPAGAPPSTRYGHAAAYDPVRDRLVIFGGLDGATARNDVWAVSLADPATWERIYPGGQPPDVRSYASLIYDPTADRMVLFGGFEPISGNSSNDTWALALSGTPLWTNLLPAGTPPAPRFLHTAVYDAIRQRMIVCAGSPALYTAPYNDTWELTLATTPTWTALVPEGTPPGIRYGDAAVYDPAGDQMVIFGGANVEWYNDTWALQWGQGVTQVTLPVDGLSIGHVRPVPARAGRLIVVPISSRGGSARLELYTSSGSRVLTQDLGALAPGPHEIPLRIGAQLTSGAYFLRVTQDGAARTSRLVVSR